MRENETKSLWDETIRDLLNKSGPGPNGGIVVQKLIAGGADTLCALIVVIGGDRVGEAVDAIGQLPIWQEEKSRRYVDECDRVVFVAAIRDLNLYGIFAQGSDPADIAMLGGSLAASPSRSEAQDALDARAKKKNWFGVPSVERLRETLAPVLGEPPNESEIVGWTELERVQAAVWAAARQIEAGGERIAVPPVPNVLAAHMMRMQKREAGSE